MSNATEQARSSRGDARAFAEAFAAADDAFTFGPSVGESRTLTLSELEAVLELDTPVGLPAESPAPAIATGDAELLTLEELCDVLAEPPAAADVLDFDFGTGTAERARRRTAARTGTSIPAPPAPRQAPGPVSRSSVRPAAAGALPLTARAAATSPARRRGVRSSAMSPAQPPARRGPQPSMMVPAPGRRPLPGSSAVQRFRAEPDRIALYAVLLAILLVLIAASSSSASAVSLLTQQLL